MAKEGCKRMQSPHIHFKKKTRLPRDVQSRKAAPPLSTLYPHTCMPHFLLDVAHASMIIKTFSAGNTGGLGFFWWGGEGKGRTAGEQSRHTMVGYSGAKFRFTSLRPDTSEERVRCLLPRGFW